MKNTKDDVTLAIDILGLTPPFSLHDLKKAYKERAKHHHPDLQPDGETSRQEMERVIWAYHFLLKNLECVKVPLSLLITTARTEEERIKERFFYDWMPPSQKGDETA